MTLDVEIFYPSISENLFQETTNFAKDIVGISDTDLSVVKQAKKTPSLMIIKHGLKIQEKRN